jgi:hypothetical protein
MSTVFSGIKWLYNVGHKAVAIKFTKGKWLMLKGTVAVIDSGIKMTNRHTPTCVPQLPQPVNFPKFVSLLTRSF